MTHYDYKIYMKNRQRLIDLKRKGKFASIPEKVKPVKNISKWEFVKKSYSPFEDSIEYHQSFA